TDTWVILSAPPAGRFASDRPEGHTAQWAALTGMCAAPADDGAERICDPQGDHPDHRGPGVGWRAHSAGGGESGDRGGAGHGGGTGDGDARPLRGRDAAARGRAGPGPSGSWRTAPAVRSREGLAGEPTPPAAAFGRRGGVASGDGAEGLATSGRGELMGNVFRV